MGEPKRVGLQARNVPHQVRQQVHEVCRHLRNHRREISLMGKVYTFSWRHYQGPSITNNLASQVCSGISFFGIVTWNKHDGLQD